MAFTALYKVYVLTLLNCTVRLNKGPQTKLPQPLWEMWVWQICYKKTMQLPKRSLRGMQVSMTMVELEIHRSRLIFHVNRYITAAQSSSSFHFDSELSQLIWGILIFGQGQSTKFPALIYKKKVLERKGKVWSMSNMQCLKETDKRLSHAWLSALTIISYFHTNNFICVDRGMHAHARPPWHWPWTSSTHTSNERTEHFG